jgi:serine/threonine protein kinase
MDSSFVDVWIFHLSKLINQKGFHELFKPIQKLGKGNFASVYEVEKVTDLRRFAVKAFSKQNTFAAKNGKESLVNELAVMRSLNHQNTLRLESVFES